MTFQTLSEIRTELSARLGFGAQPGAEIINQPVLDSIIQRAQTNILSEFGSMLPGTVFPPGPFIADSDAASVPDNALLLRSIMLGREYYRQPMSVDIDAWSNYERNARGIAS